MEAPQKPHYLNHRKRLKERFRTAPDAFTDAEIIELLLGYVIRGKDVKPQAKMILTEAKNLNGIFAGNLKAVKGVGSETLLFFDLLREFINRVDYQKIHKKEIGFDTSSAVFKFLRTKIGHTSKETCIILFMDVKNKLKTYKVMREGFINSVAISAREIIENAILNDAVSVIIAHNHPSGDPTPSDSDLMITRQICHALRYTGVTLLDHMVVSYNDYYSMSANGLIKEFYNSAK